MSSNASFKEQSEIKEERMRKDYLSFGEYT
jgi:hypothetical protein